MISMNQRGIQQTWVLRLHTYGKERHNTFAQSNCQKARRADHIVNMILADVHDVLSLVNPLLHRLHQPLHHLFLLLQSVPSDERHALPSRQVDAVDEQQFDIIQRERSQVLHDPIDILLLVFTHLVLQFSAVAVQIRDVECSEQLGSRTRASPTQKPRSTNASKRRTLMSWEEDMLKNEVTQKRMT